MRNRRILTIVFNRIEESIQFVITSNSFLSLMLCFYTTGGGVVRCWKYRWKRSRSCCAMIEVSIFIKRTAYIFHATKRGRCEYCSPCRWLKWTDYGQCVVFVCVVLVKAANSALTNVEESVYASWFIWPFGVVLQIKTYTLYTCLLGVEVCYFSTKTTPNEPISIDGFIDFFVSAITAADGIWFTSHALNSLNIRAW